ncbi:MAG TPA: LamG domain-containing protein, partial [Ferruginibacter sp.]|nr:LamG domain-containing protein [Ferruginibacter sp.]
FPTDATEPGGPLKFYAAFDGTSPDPLRNAVDSIRANFAADNPLASVDGIKGKAIKGESKKFIKYQKPNDWALTAKSLTVSFWFKRDGQTKNNTGTNGPEYIYSFKSSNGHWSGASGFILLEGNNAGCAVKYMIVDKTNGDKWFEWAGGTAIPGILNNQWHHIALSYNAATSGMTLYVDGVANPVVSVWGGHGDIKMDDSKISEMRIGAGPGTGMDTDDWLSSTWKGEIDQFRLYSIPLTQAEVNELFTKKL